jgi:hypothetical protein
MKDQYEKIWEKFFKETEDFRSGKRKNYPTLLTRPLYIDSELWGPEPEGGKIHKPQTKEQRQKQLRYRQDTRVKVETLWGLLCWVHGLDPVMPHSMAGWKKLCEELVGRHVQGFQITNTPPKLPKRRGAKKTRGPLYYIELVHEVDEACARYAKTHKVKKVPPLTVIDNPKLLAKWRTASGKLQTANTLVTRYRETKKMMEAARERGPDPKFRPLAELAELYKNSK